jgi:hypothetical protein
MGQSQQKAELVDLILQASFGQLAAVSEHSHRWAKEQVSYWPASKPLPDFQ